jgi:broad specificity phosphatase PhoE
VKTFYFVRHGRTEWNAVGRMQGQLNSRLDECGRAQAAVHGRLLATFDVDAIFVSTLDRALQTAAIIRRYVDLDARADARIMERNCGEWSGHLLTEVGENWPREWAALEADPYHYRGPGCENFPDMFARIRPFIEERLAEPACNIAIVSHGMIGRVMIGWLMGFDEAQMLGFRQPNDVIYRVRLPHGVAPESRGADKSADNGAASPRLDHYVAGSGPFDGVVPR